MNIHLFAIVIGFFGITSAASAHSLDDHQHYHCHKSMDCHSHVHHNDHH